MIKKKERDKQSDWNIFISKSERRGAVLPQVTQLGR